MSSSEPSAPFDPQQPEFKSYLESNIQNNLEFNQQIIADDKGAIIGVVGVIHDISDRVAAKIELQTSKDFLNAVIDSIPDPFFVKDDQHRWIILNQAFCQIIGYPKEQLLGKSDYDVFPQEEADIFCAKDKLVLSSGVSNENEEFLTDNLGLTHYISTKKSLIRDQLGNKFLVGIIRDLTERKKIENDLTTLNESLEHAVEGISRLDVDGYYAFVNPAYANFCGYEPQEMIGMSWQITVYPEDVPIVEAAIPRIIEVGKIEVEVRCIRKDGKIFYKQVTMVLINDKDGNYLGNHCFMKDISDRKQAELKLQESQRFIQQIADASPNILYLHNYQEHRNTYISNHVTSILGYTPQEIQAMGTNLFLNLVHPNDFSRLSNHQSKIMGAADGEIFEIEYRMRHLKGYWLWLYIRESVFSRDDRGIVKLIVGTALSINDLKLAEENLYQSQELLRQTIENTPIGISTFDIEGRFLSANSSACEMLGYCIDEMLQMTTVDISHPDSIDKTHAAMYQLITNQVPSIQFEKQYFHKSGRIIDAIMHLGLVRDVNSNPIQFVAGIEDITDRKKDEITLHQHVERESTLHRQVQKELAERKRVESELRSSLKEKEVLIKEVHHRVKNNLQMISSLLNLQSNYIESPEMRKPFIESQKRIRTMALIHEKLYSSNNLAKINFGEYINELVKDLSYSYVTRDNIKFSVEVDPIQMSIDQAIPYGLIINELISNSVKYAFPDHQNGEISIQFTQVKQNITDLNTNSNQFSLIIRDNGIGITEDFDLHNISSLGLQIVQGFINQLRGTISLERADGTTVRMLFPV